MFEEDHPQSPAEAPKKRVGTAVLLAAGGVVVATLFATVASMLAASGREASPERTGADVVQTVTSVAPDGSTSTVLVTVSSDAPSSVKPDRRQAARPQEQPKPGTPEQPQLTTDPAQPTQTQPESTPPPHTEPPSSTPPSSASSATPPSSTPSSTGAPDPKP
ncbi:hypothetical protein SAMN04488074_11115 [Lentzea albidocapillata subsp. violacea]|uniref:Uncharacterized protein n=1 Tax=Lentzea albidocapillata subsp. violacea TaxID=128104 RepID=A0A1G9K357_9PSEU|nr:hypothetical protein [Lentzea albidocapillata]SDL44092.1 hypothetical protein SAMN04488074_11115 [Lentzea albidocapillata subsp. violacea]